LIATLGRRERIQLKSEYDQFKQHANENFFSSKEVRVAERIELKKDAQVMLLWNLDLQKKLANGSRGIVKGFFDPEEYADLIAKEVERREKATKVSCSTEPNQDGNAAESTETSDLDNAVKPGVNDREEMIIAIKEYLSNLAEFELKRESNQMQEIIETDVEDLPFVHFATGEHRIIRPQPFSKIYKKIGTATRWQIPLTLAWSVTVHKSQGMTIDLLSVGKSYVYMLSRDGANLTSNTLHIDHNLRLERLFCRGSSICCMLSRKRA
jgi:ATP-dependent DNA helicase PIF1